MGMRQFSDPRQRQRDNVIELQRHEKIRKMLTSRHLNGAATTNKV